MGTYSCVAGSIHGLNFLTPRFTAAEMEIIKAATATAIPKDLIPRPRPTDTAESLRERLANYDDFDVLLMQRSGKLHHRMKSTRQCYRRFMFMAAVKELPHV